jgi:chemotaxis protein CheC
MSISTESKNDNQLKSFLVAAKAGVVKASEALKVLSASAIRMEVISAGIAPTSRLSEISGNPEDLVAGIYLSITGDIPGHSLLVFQYDSALHLIDMVTGQPIGTTTHIEEMEQSVLQEIGNILTSAYLNALSDYFGKTLLPSPPGVAIDMAAAVVDSVLLNTGHFDEDTLSIVTRFAGPKKSLRGFFLYIPEINRS